MTEPSAGPGPQRPYPGLATLLGIGSLSGVCVAAGVFSGLAVDQRLGSTPLFTIVGLACGIVGAAFASYRVIRRYLKG
ncbi:MAG: AtpZ/AtpI family protein [Mycobacteriales bacterium]